MPRVYYFVRIAKKLNFIATSNQFNGVGSVGQICNDNLRVMDPIVKYSTS
jgi:hypothetical protein